MRRQFAFYAQHSAILCNFRLSHFQFSGCFSWSEIIRKSTENANWPRTPKVNQKQFNCTTFLRTISSEIVFISISTARFHNHSGRPVKTDLFCLFNTFLSFFHFTSDNRDLFNWRCLLSLETSFVCLNWEINSHKTLSTLLIYNVWCKETATRPLRVRLFTWARFQCDRLPNVNARALVSRLDILIPLMNGQHKLCS